MSKMSTIKVFWEEKIMATQVRNLATVEAEIAQVKEDLANVKGTETEVYARIVGYYRSVRNWNKGKRDEYHHRKQFVYDGVNTSTRVLSQNIKSAPVIETTQTNISGTPASYEFFARTTCPNCPPVKKYLADCILPGTYVDVDTASGLEKAASLGVFAAPTVIIYDNLGNEIARAHKAKDLSMIFESAKTLQIA